MPYPQGCTASPSQKQVWSYTMAILASLLLQHSQSSRGKSMHCCAGITHTHKERNNLYVRELLQGHSRERSQQSPTCATWQRRTPRLWHPLKFRTRSPSHVCKHEPGSAQTVLSRAGGREKSFLGCICECGHSEHIPRCWNEAVVYGSGRLKQQKLPQKAVVSVQITY